MACWVLFILLLVLVAGFLIALWRGPLRVKENFKPPSTPYYQLERTGLKFQGHTDSARVSSEYLRHVSAQ